MTTSRKWEVDVEITINDTVRVMAVNEGDARARAREHLQDEFADYDRVDITVWDAITEEPEPVATNYYEVEYLMGLDWVTREQAMDLYGVREAIEQNTISRIVHVKLGSGPLAKSVGVMWQYGTLVDPKGVDRKTAFMGWRMQEKFMQPEDMTIIYKQVMDLWREACPNTHFFQLVNQDNHVASRQLLEGMGLHYAGIYGSQYVYCSKPGDQVLALAMAKLHKDG